MTDHWSNPLTPHAASGRRNISHLSSVMHVRTNAPSLQERNLAQYGPSAVDIAARDLKAAAKRLREITIERQTRLQTMNDIVQPSPENKSSSSSGSPSEEKINFASILTQVDEFLVKAKKLFELDVSVSDAEVIGHYIAQIDTEQKVTDHYASTRMLAILASHIALIGTVSTKTAKIHMYENMALTLQHIYYDLSHLVFVDVFMKKIISAYIILDSAKTMHTQAEAAISAWTEANPEPKPEPFPFTLPIGVTERSSADLMQYIGWVMSAETKLSEGLAITERDIVQSCSCSFIDDGKFQCDCGDNPLCGHNKDEELQVSELGSLLACEQPAGMEPFAAIEDNSTKSKLETILDKQYPLVPPS